MKRRTDLFLLEGARVAAVVALLPVVEERLRLMDCHLVVLDLLHDVYQLALTI